MKNRVPILPIRFFGAGLLAVATFGCIAQKTLAAQPAPDPAHAAHVAAGAMPPDVAQGDPALSQQLSQLQAKVAQLESALAKNAPPAPAGATPAAGAMPGMAAPAAPMAGMKSAAPGAMKPTGDMGGMASPAGVAMPPDAAKGDPALSQQLSQISQQLAQLSQQLSQLQAKVVQLEAGLAENAPGAPVAAAPAAGAMPGMAAPASPMAGMKSTAPAAIKRAGGMGRMAAPPGGTMSVGQKSIAAEPPADPADTAQLAAGVIPPDAAKGDPALSQQLSQLQAKVTQLEAGLAGDTPRPPVAAAPAAGAMPGMAAPAASMAGMKSAAPAPMTAPGGMGGMAAPPGGTTSVEPKALAAEPPADPADAAQLAAGAMPPDAAKGDPAPSQQLSQLQAKVAQLEATLAKSAPHSSAVAAPAASAMPGKAAPAAPMAGMKSAAPGAKTAAEGMGGMSPPGETANKMAVMEKMMGMMDKMMSMDDGAMPAGAPMAGGADMGMGMMKSKMGGRGGGAMPAGAPAPGMSGGGAGMAMEKMEMAEMMGMGAMSSGAAGTMPQSVLPGFPGASHLYHIGATDFFLDHPQHVTLTTEQQAALNKAKEQALLAKGTADRAVAQAEQDLWTLTASDQPDTTKIDAKVREIEKLRGDQRLDLIRTVGEAAKLLTDEQRQSLLGLKPPPPQGMPAMPAAPAAGMGDM